MPLTPRAFSHARSHLRFSRVLLDGPRNWRESAHSVFLSLHVDIPITISFSLHMQGEKKPTFHDATTGFSAK